MSKLLARIGRQHGRHPSCGGNEKIRLQRLCEMIRVDDREAAPEAICCIFDLSVAAREPILLWRARTDMAFVFAGLGNRI